jgi:hypothetical protein
MKSVDLDLWAKVDILERYRIPIYLGSEFRAYYVSQRSLPRKLYAQASKEVTETYRLAYADAHHINKKKEVVRSFIQNFPNIAFKSSDLLRDLYQALLKEKETDSLVVLKEIAHVIKPSKAGLSKFKRQRKIEIARQVYLKLKDPTLHGGNRLILSFKNIKNTAWRSDVLHEERGRIKKCLNDLECYLSVTSVLRLLKKETPAHCLRLVAANAHGLGAESIARKTPLEALNSEIRTPLTP